MTQHIPISRSAAFPDLEPDGAAAWRKRRRSRTLSRSLEFAPRIELVHDSAQDEEMRPERREESTNEIARLTVYVMNIIAMLISFPIGMAVLLFNILGGENVRLTAHAIALAGFASALATTELGARILPIF